MLAKAGETSGSDPAAEELGAEAVIKVLPSFTHRICSLFVNIESLSCSVSVCM